MIKVKVYNEKGEVQKEVDLNPVIFGVKANPTLIHQVIVAMMNNQRNVYAHVKDRGEVRGGGIKPWRQKGTGRARHGSIRSPIWIGGGVTFGPSPNRNFSQKINKKMRRKALLMLLSDKVNDNNLVLIDKLEATEYKTKRFASMIKNLKLDGSLLIVNDKIDDKFIKSINNLPRTEIIEARNLNALAVAKYRKVLMSEAALEVLNTMNLGKLKSEKNIDGKVDVDKVDKKLRKL